MSELKQAIIRVGAKLEGMKCPSCGGKGGALVTPQTGDYRPCIPCNSTGLQYWRLLELFRVEYKEHEPQVWGYQDVTCKRCNIGLPNSSPCIVPRLDLAETEGALAGALLHATKDWPFWDKDGECIWDTESPNLAAVCALEEVLG